MTIGRSPLEQHFETYKDEDGLLELAPNTRQQGLNRDQLHNLINTKMKNSGDGEWMYATFDNLGIGASAQFQLAPGEYLKVAKKSSTIFDFESGHYRELY